MEKEAFTTDGKASWGITGIDNEAEDIKSTREEDTMRQVFTKEPKRNKLLHKLTFENNILGKKRNIDLVL